MKIAVNTRFLIHGKLEGIGIHTHEICKRMVSRHPEVEFHFIFDRPYHDDFIYGDNVVPHIVYPPARHPFLWLWWFEWSLPQLFNKIQPNVFFSPDMYMSLRASCPTLISSHDLAYIHYPEHLRTSHLLFFRHFFPRYHKRAERIACVSAFTRNDVILQFDIDPDKSFVAHNAARSDFNPMSERDIINFRCRHFRGRPYFLYLGAIHPRKNIVSVVEAYETFRSKEKSPVLLVLAGRMAWKTQEVKQKIQDSKFKEDIIIIADPDPIISELVAAAFAMVYVSLFEGFGLPIVEAMQAHVPVITSNRGATREIAGEAALLVNPDHPGDIAHAMLTMAKESAARQRQIQLGQERASLFNWDQTAERIFSQLKEIAAPSGTNKSSRRFP